MRHIGYILKTKHYYITCLILTFLFLAISLAFTNVWTRTTETLKTFNQCSANTIAYDAVPDITDSFANYERNARVSLSEEEGESLNVFVYQFLENTNYTDKSIVNSQNVVFEGFNVLNANEIAIPISIAKQHDLSVGDNIFVNGESCEIKFIFRDVYQIYDVNFSISQTVVLVGINTVGSADVVNYCNFNPAETVHQQMRSLNPIRKNLSSQRAVYLISISILTIACSFIMTLFRRKEEVKAFRNYRLSGGRATLRELLLVELMFIMPCILVVFGIGYLMSVSITLLTSVCVVAVLGWIMNLGILCLRVKR